MTIVRKWLPADAIAQGAPASEALDIPDAERRLIVNALPSRRREFIAARWCAHRALEELACPADTIPGNSLGAPDWPAGVAGSITHESGLCLAAVARTARVQGMGIDLFDTRRVVDMFAIADLVVTNDDIARSTTGEIGQLFLKLAFSAKESVVKAVSQKMGRFLDLTEIELSLHDHGFRAVIPGFSYRISGRWAAAGPFLVTLALLES